MAIERKTLQLLAPVRYVKASIRSSISGEHQDIAECMNNSSTSSLANRMRIYSQAHFSCFGVLPGFVE